MKTQKSSFLLKISVLALFLLLSSVSHMNAQVIVSPYPDVDNGQQLLISPGDEWYDLVMDQATVTRTMAQDDINASYPDNPVTTDYWSCHGAVCCQTSYGVINGVTVYVTKCTVGLNSEPVDIIVQ